MKHPLFWQFNDSKSVAKVAIRDGEWKLVASLRGVAKKIGADITDLEMAPLRVRQDSVARLLAESKTKAAEIGLLF